MDKKIKILIIIFTILISIFSYTSIYAHNKFNLFNDILTISKGKVVECGIKTTFETEGNTKEMCNQLIEELQIKNTSLNIENNNINNRYTIKFKNNLESGYIETFKYNNKNIVSINIQKKSTKNEIESLKNSIEKVTRYKHKKYFAYTRIKLQNSSDLHKTNEEIVEFLKRQGTIDINTININNGYSTVAYTRRYDSIKNNGKLMDLNFALCSYSSGKYLIIGTPEIIASY